MKIFFFSENAGLVRDERCEGAYWNISTESVVTEMTVIKERKNSNLSIVQRSICISVSRSLILRNRIQRSKCSLKSFPDQRVACNFHC